MNFKVYRKEGSIAKRPHLDLPSGTFEEEFGLDGFFGPVSHLYHRHPPTTWKDLRKSKIQWPDQKSEMEEDFLKPLCFAQPFKDQLGQDFFESKKLAFWNEDLEASFHHIEKTNPIYFRNADASEVIFCHSGSGVLESPFGELQFSEGDYLSIPKGCAFRLKCEKPLQLLRFESLTSHFSKPQTGILGQQALYHEENIRSPKLYTGAFESGSIVRVQKEARLSEIEYAFDIRNLSGWCGTLFPFALSVNDIAPILSTMAHLPPSVNATFVTKNFILCTFLPRPLEEPEGALKVPFFHSNIDYDEIIFYHAGNFFSRDGMTAGSTTLHPRGIHHGPHPKALASQGLKKRTDEIAVMCDVLKPLKVSKAFADLENKNYWKSWQ